MKLRNPGKLGKSHLFSCGFLCTDVVLSPAAPPESTHPETSAPTPPGSDDNKENHISPGAGGETHRRFQRVPSSTQWDLALKMHKRSLKSATLAPSPNPQENVFQDPFHLESLVRGLSESGCLLTSVTTLRNLRSLVGEDIPRNRNLVVDLGLHGELVGFLDSDQGNELENSELVDEAFGLLLALAGDEKVVQTIIRAPGFTRCLERFLRTGTGASKLAAVEMLVKLCEFGELHSEGLVAGVLALLNAREEKLVRAGVKGLLALCLTKENRPAAARGGGAPALFGALQDFKGLAAERCLATLELLSTTPEGRAAIRDHPPAVPLLLSMILRVSDRGTEYASGVLCSICTPDDLEVLETACQARASTLLLLLLQSNCTQRARRKALKLLKVLHSYTTRERGPILRDNIQH